ncbi:unnamed protein product [Mytilus edulis]|uniref:Uncharacterized protein n=1 Tax=Mytilus edulis TaxID=6550 RepID=A0A8S3R818_MYTED|nr:unnamed protein product [Mytilus edulis]
MIFLYKSTLSLSQEQCSRSTGDYELLENLTLSIQGHLKRFKITGEIESEGRLIAVRLGIFDEQSKWGNLTVCSHHRKLLGVQWAPKERHTCQYPMHQGKGKPERSITLKNSKDIQKLYGKILQVGTECSFQENSANRTFSLVHKTGEFQQDQIQECCMEENSPGSVFGSLPITEDYQQDQIQGRYKLQVNISYHYGYEALQEEAHGNVFACSGGNLLVSALLQLNNYLYQCCKLTLENKMHSQALVNSGKKMHSQALVNTGK